MCRKTHIGYSTPVQGMAARGVRPRRKGVSIQYVPTEARKARKGLWGCGAPLDGAFSAVPAEVSRRSPGGADETLPVPPPNRPLYSIPPLALYP